MSVSTKWRMIETGIGSGYWNMAVDEALMERYREDQPPIIRLYGWETGISAGRYSDLSKSVDLKKIRSLDFPLVRRMSGGGVLVHGGDLSYSLILPRSFCEGDGVRESYRRLSRFLITMFEKLGLKAVYAHEVPCGIQRSEICLAGNEPYDILIQGSKMGGNAQRHKRHAIFQHGIIPMKLDHEIFEPFFVGDSGLERAAYLQKFGIDLSYGQLSKLLSDAFSETFGATMVIDGLSSSEEKYAHELLSSKYTHERWNIDGKTSKP